MAKRRKTTRFTIQSYDAAHYRTTEEYAKAVDALFTTATTEISRAAAKGQYNPEKPFAFDDYPSVKSVMQKATSQLASRMTAVIETGTQKQWLYACKKNDKFIASIIDTSKLAKKDLEQMQDQRLDALATFQGRKVQGLNLSQRVWKYVGQYKEQLESALDVGLGEGRSAQQLARDVKQNLNEPNRLFRRVRDKRGNLVLSKAAKAYHPGRGVYRSSVKNAQRLTRSEINMAYRESDYQRWQSLDFVVGYEVFRSNHEPLCKCEICEQLVGRYPKTFKFVGWHPQCMCFAVPILRDFYSKEASDDRVSRLRAALNGTEYKKYTPKETVTDVPEGFKKWVAKYAERQKNWKSTPYFIRDNFVDGQLSKGLKINIPVTKAVTYLPYEKLKHEERWKFIVEMDNFTDEYIYLFDACAIYGVSSASLEAMWEEVNNKKQYWRMPELRSLLESVKAQVNVKIEECRLLVERAISEYEEAIKGNKAWVGESSVTERCRQYMREEANEKYPNYKQFLNSANGGSLDASILRSQIEKAKVDYNKAIAEAKACITKCGGKVDVSKLNTLVNETRTETRYATVITNDIKKEIANVELKYADATQGVCAQNISELKTRNVDYIAVKKHEKALSIDDIINRVGGGDNTEGSCASLGLAYAANRGGYNVLDFRDGESRKYFCSKANKRIFIEKLGGVTQNNSGKGSMSGIELMRTTEIGKEYYIGIGRHASIVRQVSKGKFEYLELQSRSSNGWKTLSAKEFAWRFSAKGRQSLYSIIEISKLYNDDSFIEMMGYVNTAADKQVKGATGSIK